MNIIYDIFYFYDIDILKRFMDFSRKAEYFLRKSNEMKADLNI